MYKIQLLEQRKDNTVKTLSIEHEHTWDVAFKNDKEARNFLKKAEKIKTDEQNEIEMLSIEDIAIGIHRLEPFTWIIIFDEYDTHVGSNFYRKEAYSSILIFIERTLKEEGRE